MIRMMIKLFLLWIITTLTVASLSIVLARKFGKFIIYGVFSMLVLISNIAAGKIMSIDFFGHKIVVPAVVAIYSTTFLLTDALSEIYGKNTAKRAVISGFIANIFAIPLIYIVTKIPPADFNIEFAKMFNEVFKLVPQIIFASMLAYIVSQLHDVYIYHWYKKKTKGKYMWFRNNASTAVSQLIDSAVFISIAFYGVFPLEIIKTMIFYQWVAKIIIAFMDTPFLYIVTYFAKIVKV